MNLFDLALEAKDYEWCRQLYELYKDKFDEIKNKPSEKLTIYINVLQLIPFALLNHAEQYVNEDLKGLKGNGVIIDCSSYDEKYPWAVAILEIK